jgi:glucose/arabinose dehydrogenase
MRSIRIVLLFFFLTACSSLAVRESDTAPASPSIPDAPVSAQPTPSEPTIPPKPELRAPREVTTLPEEPLSLLPTVPSPQAPKLPDPTLAAWLTVASDLNSPVGLMNAGDGTGRLFVIEQAGRIMIIKDGKVDPRPFLDIRDRVGSNGNEQGLLGLAFHPQYNSNAYFFVNYTDLEGNTIIARFRAAPEDSLRADPASEIRLLQIQQPFPNHNGGQVAFGPDGYLYLGLGDGGSGGDPLGNGQSLNTLLGKILRLDVDQGQPYAAPSKNQFAENQKPEIWAYGLRNPWRFSFDRLTGDLYIGDVGQNKWEEINFLPAGSPAGTNFGWNYFEGAHPYSSNPPPQGLVTIFPAAEYDHSQGCSVTSGFVYRGSQLPEWQGVYLFGDFCTGNVWGMLRDAQDAWQQKLLFENAGQITSFGEDESGEVYLVDRAGVIKKLVKQ